MKKIGDSSASDMATAFEEALPAQVKAQIACHHSPLWLGVIANLNPEYIATSSELRESDALYPSQIRVVWSVQRLSS